MRLHSRIRDAGLPDFVPGATYKGLTDFVLADLGQVRYEAYPLEPGCRMFQTRAEVDFLLALDGLRTELEAGGDLAAVTGRLLAMERCPGIRAQRRYHRLLNELGRAWERAGEVGQALDCYRHGALPPARERTVRILSAQGRSQEAAAMALAMAEAPQDPGEARLARRFLERLAPRELPAARWLERHPPDPPVPEVRLRLPRHPSGSVEQAALEAARAASGWNGFQTENTLWNALYGLAFWDILFAPVPGAFQHRFQSAPADLRQPEFHARRAPAIAARMAELAEPGGPARIILPVLERKRGVANAFVNWRRLLPGQVEIALDTLPPAALLAVLGELAPNPWAFRSGFPDLFLHRQGRCRLWEVKGPGDSLRPEQERWLKRLNRSGVEAQVARVEYLY